MKILTSWLRFYLPNLPADLSDSQLADDLTLRGIAVEGVHDLGTNSAGQPKGHLFEMDITTNRVDAMNHYGIAREAATIYDLPLAPLDTILPPESPGSPASAPACWGESVDAVEAPASRPPQMSPAPPFPVRIDPSADGLCGRFTARVLRNITIVPSIGRMAEFFSLLGQKQISNAVDASNFTLLGMGQPTHAFDLDTIEGGIVVRLARPGEKLKLLDGTERILDPEDLVIADDRKALSLAGVMGGFQSMITPATKNILIESAWFDPAAIRASSRRHLLHTDASHRFERGADFNAAPLANHLVAELILEHGGTPEGDLIDIVNPSVATRTSARPPIPLSVREVQRHLGTTLDAAEPGGGISAEIVRRYLIALGCQLSPATHAAPAGITYTVALPSWRLDLAREIDLIEEIARVYGYNRFANTLPMPRPVVAHPSSAPEQAVRTRLLALGYSEVVSSTFASAPDSDLFAASTPVPLENPLSEEASNLRPSLVAGMLSMLAHNLNRDVTDVRLFEQGQVFAATGSTPTDVGDVIETASLSLGLTGSIPATSLHTALDSPIFELKGVIESLVSFFTTPGGPHALTFTSANTPAWIEPGRGATALLNHRPLAHFGELSRAESSRRKLRQPVFLAEIDLAHLQALPLRKVTARDLSRFQAAGRDFSFTFPDATEWHTVAAAIGALSIPDLRRLTPVEIFRDPKGKAVSPGHHALLLRTVFQSNDRTLRDEELTEWSARIIAALTALGGVLRA
jgi:phenylalanyl-tRNA synthetase beta chain